MIDHVGIRVADVERSKKFYEEAFKPLGYVVSFGKEKVFWSFALKVEDVLFEIFQNEEKEFCTTHVAFRVNSKDEVAAFHKAAIEVGGKDNGAPGPRPDYTPNYYSAFVLDPDGHNIEAVFYT